ncbi:MAG: acetylglutamate kinase [Burkholderiales bacterium]|nr:acetylglutamate kinase [Burkholderiales bacterium]
MNNKIIVIKCGGSIMNSITETNTLCKNIMQLHKNNIKVILVHGGGPEINKLTKLHSVESKFINGIRVTSAATIELCYMALIGINNTKIVQQLNKCSIDAVGLSGLDSGLLNAEYLDFNNLGYVGKITHVNSTILNILLKNNIVPVIAPLAFDNNYNALNINADMVASSIAAKLNADTLVLLSDIDGYYKNYPDKTSLVKTITIHEIKNLLTRNEVIDGMIPKLQACYEAVNTSVNNAYIINANHNYHLDKLIQNEEILGTKVIKGTPS